MGEKCIKATLMVFNIITLMGGIAMIACGLLITYQPTIVYSLAGLAGINATSTLLGSLGYAMVGLGGVIFLVSFIGCCGAVSESKCMVGLYCILICLLFIGQLTIGILGIIQGQRGVRDALTEGMTDLTSSYIRHEDTLSKIQESFKCCGVNGTESYWKNEPVDMATSTTATTTIKPAVVNGTTLVTIAPLTTTLLTTTMPTTTTPTTVKATTLQAGNTTTSNGTFAPTKADTQTSTQSTTAGPKYPYWPDSCCIKNSTGILDTAECHNFNQQNITIMQQYVYTDGCVDAVTKFIDQNLILLGGCALGLSFVEFFAIIISFKLYRTFD